MTVFQARSTSGGCAIGLLLKPFTVMTMSGLNVAGGNGILVAGVASDTVAHMKLFLPHGRVRGIPLKDNTFLISLTTADSLYNLVAYDDNGAIIGTTASHPITHLP